MQVTLAQNTGSIGGGVKRDSTEEDPRPLNQIISLETLFPQLHSGGGPIFSEEKIKSDQLKARSNELGIQQIDQTDLDNITHLVTLANEVKRIDYVCSNENELRPLTMDLKNLNDLTQKLTLLKFNSLIKGGGIGPLFECDCDKDKKYLKCLEQGFNTKVLTPIVEASNKSSADQEKIIKAYKLYHFNTNKSAKQLEADFEYMLEFLPGCFKNN